MVDLLVEFLLFVVSVGIPVLVWFLFSLKIVGPDEMAVKVYFGHPWDVCDSGLRFVPFCFGFTYLKQYPKKMYNLEYKNIETFTLAGEYKKEKYGSIKVGVDVAAYLSFPRPDISLRGGEIHPLIEIVRADVPVDEFGLQKWTRETVEGAVRLAFGQVIWKQSAEDTVAINAIIGKIFKDPDGALIKVGFSPSEIRLVIAQIRLPKEVEDALTGPEKTRLQAEAAVKDAEAQAIDRLETILYAIARSEGVDINVIKERVKTDKNLQRELLDYVKSLQSDLEKADRKAYFKLESSGNPLLDAIALYSQIVLGSGLSSSQKTSRKGGSNAKRRRQKGQGPGNSGSSRPMDDEDEDEEVF